MLASETQNDVRILLASRIVRAYVANNSIPAGELPSLIVSVDSTLAGIASGQTSPKPAEDVSKPTSAQVRKSIGQDGIVSFIDGRTYKTLKRHLSKNDLTPMQYRERFGLPNDYPMVCASYSARRSELAKQTGLGSYGIRKDQAVAQTSAKAPSKTQRAVRKAA